MHMIKLVLAGLLVGRTASEAMNSGDWYTFALMLVLGLVVLTQRIIDITRENKRREARS